MHKYIDYKKIVVVIGVVSMLITLNLINDAYYFECG